MAVEIPFGWKDTLNLHQASKRIATNSRTEPIRLAQALRF